MTKTTTAGKKASHLKYSNDSHSDYLKMYDFIRLKWRHIFEGKSQYSSNMFRNFILSMWKVESMKLSDACLNLPELKSANTQREYIYKLFEFGLLESDVYIGTDKSKRESEASYGRGKTSPSIWLSEDARRKVDLYLDEAVDEVVKMADSVTNPAELSPKPSKTKVRRLLAAS